MLINGKNRLLGTACFYIISFLRNGIIIAEEFDYGGAVKNEETKKTDKPI